MKVAVVGAGRLGTAVAVALRRAGHRMVGVSGRAETRVRAHAHLPDVPVLEPTDAAAAAELVIVGTPDDLIEPTVRTLVDSGAVATGSWVLHLSGALGLEALRPARSAGAHVLAIHPLQTFPDVGSAIDGLPGCWIAVTAEDEEGFGLGERLAHDLGGSPFRLDEAMRPLYHAAAVFASNYLIAASAIAESLFELAGVPDPAGAMAPLQRASLEHVERLGAARALTGPAVRGDAGTLERNLDALGRHAPALVAPYVAMARATVELAARSGRLDPASRAAAEDVLARWS